MHQDWKTQNIVVTGAASGLGRAICARFAHLDASVRGIDVGKARLQELKDALGENFIPVICDVANCEEVVQVFDQFPSIDVLVNSAGMIAYSASKAAVIGMTKVQGKEVAGTGVTVNALAPAVLLTPMVQALPEQQVKYMTDRIPMGRCGTLDEFVAMVEFIVSPSCSFTTGFTFDLSGGRATY